MNHLDTGSLISGFSSLGQQPGLSTDVQPQTSSQLGEMTALVSDEVSTLGDAAEELSLHMAEKTEEKHHAERKVKAERPVEVLNASEIVEMLEQSKDADAQEKLTELTKKILEGQGSPRQLAGQSFGDVTQQYLGLQYALREGERQGAAPETLEAIRDALADMEVESGPQIRAGLNTLGSASEFAADAQGVLHFQNTYRDIVLGENSLAKTLELALQRFGSQDVARGLSQLVTALGQDLAAARPSTDPRRLQALTGDLYHLQVAVTVLDGCGELSGKLQAGGHDQIDSQRLMRDLVGISGEKWVSESRFTNLAQQHGVVSPEGRVTFLSGIKAMMRELPLQVYPDTDTRQSILNAVQEALDIAIDAEEDQQ